MAVAYDAESNVAAATTDLSWTHTPSGTPKGALVLVTQNVGSGDEVVGVTYGGVAMTEVAGSPIAALAGDEPGVVYGFFLGSSVPTGAQTVIVDVNATGSSKRAVCLTVTAAADTQVHDTSTVDVAGTLTPSVTLTVSAESFVAGAIHSGVGAPSSILEDVGYTLILEHDYGAQMACFVRRTANATTDAACGWTHTAPEDAAILAVAVTEVAAGGVARSIGSAGGVGLSIPTTGAVAYASEG